ncbi:hypothetical protein AB0E11_27705 [Streptomyces fradiae]|uniref:hypothetical protein n=1 Tax=Streptomyces fradiae TaxID=1906 RepID=UPI003400CC3B
MFIVGDVVLDRDRGRVGTVRDYLAGVLELHGGAGYAWRAVARRCELVTPASSEREPLRWPAGTAPVTVGPLDIRTGDWVRLEDDRVYQVEDMRAYGPGGRVLHLRGRARPWVMTHGERQVYRPVGK